MSVQDFEDFLADGEMNARYSHVCAYLFDHKQAASDALCRFPLCSLEPIEIYLHVTAHQIKYPPVMTALRTRTEQLYPHRQVFPQTVRPDKEPMALMPTGALILKLQGNTHYKDGKYQDAVDW